MADGGPPAPQPPPVPPVQPVEPHAPPTQLVVPPVQPGLLPQLNLLHFKPEFPGKPDEDAEAHPLRMNDWMTLIHFKKVSKSKGFV